MMRTRKCAVMAAVMTAAAMAVTGCGSSNASTGASAATTEAAAEATTVAETGDTVEEAAEDTSIAETETADAADTEMTPAEGQDEMEYVSEKFIFCYDPKSIESFDQEDGSVVLSYVNPDVQVAGSNTVEISLVENTTAEDVLKEKMEKKGVTDGEISESSFGADGVKSYIWTYGGTKAEGSDLCVENIYIAVPCGEDVILIDGFRTIGPDEEVEMAVDDAFSAVFSSFQIFENGLSAETELANPMTEYESIEAMNKDAMGSMIYCPDDAATDQTFIIYKTADKNDIIAEYDYTLNGRKYMVRFSPDFTASISGLYGTGDEEFSDPNAENFNEFSYVKGPDYYCAHWLTVDGQYIFAALDSADMDENEFAATAQEYHDGTIRADS